MKLYFIAALLIVSVGNKCYAQSEQKLQNEILKEERLHPLKHLGVYNVTVEQNKVITQHPDFFHHTEYRVDGWNVSGYVRSNASFAAYKDVVILVVFYSPTYTVLGTTTYTLYSFFRPRSNTPFKIKVYPPDGATIATPSVQGATAVN